MKENKSVRRGGRPSQLAASQTRDRILDAATELFLTQGYGATSIEAVAKNVGISKRTFYHRFDDKAALFGAVVHRLISRMRPADIAPLFEGSSLNEILHRLADIILHAALSKDAIALHRLMMSEATRFPELSIIMDTEGSKREAVERIAGLLGHHAINSANSAKKGAIFAAEQFLQMIIAVPQQRAMGLGTPMTPAELSAWAKDAVDLFLNGWLHPSQ